MEYWNADYSRKKHINLALANPWLLADSLMALFVLLLPQ